MSATGSPLQVPPEPSPGPLNQLPLMHPEYGDRELTRSLLAFVLNKPGKGWWTLFGFCSLLSVLMGVCIVYTLEVGVGVWGVNIPVGWGFAIVNFVWWIGIGHAGTLISAILLLLEQKWRASINRFAEAMTLFAVMQAGIYPLMHLGRPWFFYWLFPYPSTMQVWPQFRSALPWDAAAVSTYFAVSLLFWYLGLIPDLGAARDASPPGLRRKVYGLASLGWRNSARHWHHFRIAYLLLAGLATPLVLSVHSIVSMDFAISLIPGWHTTIFPPYFVAGAIFSGFALVLTLILPARKAIGLEHVITRRHIDNMCKVLLVTGLMVAYGYIQEHFFAWYSGNPYEMGSYQDRRTGFYMPLFVIQMVCNVLVPQLMWIGRLRQKLWLVWIVSLLVNVGMWLERFEIVVVPLSHDFLPSSWGLYFPTWVDLGLFAGTMGFFGFCFLLFLKFVPPVPIHEARELRRELEETRALEAEVDRRLKAKEVGR